MGLNDQGWVWGGFVWEREPAIFGIVLLRAQQNREFFPHHFKIAFVRVKVIGVDVDRIALERSAKCSVQRNRRISEILEERFGFISIRNKYGDLAGFDELESFRRLSEVEEIGGVLRLSEIK